ncbi:MAG TPA: hypothetical protein VEC12_05790, partial [Bacteroidia bacterium]|nr:hypothetical protein [Bacteroidia bacterium]
MLAVTCIFAARPALASHLMGSDITYRCLGKYKYEVTLIVYRDCKGIPVSTNDQILDVICNSTRGRSYFPLTYISLRDITNVGKKCNVSSSCSGGSFPYGIQEYTFKATIDLIWDSVCTDFTFSWQDDGRNSLTTAIPSQYFPLYTKATVYLDQDACNNSPVFTTPAAAMVCVGTDFVFNNGALDTIDNDLLTYRLIDPLLGANDPLTYLSPYSATRPLMFLGFPDVDAPLPGGFHLDSLTGNLTFRPTLVNQVTVLVLEVTEWRWDVSTYKKVGVTRRDMQLSVINCDGNKPPVITGNVVNVCAGAPLDILITANDADAGDSIQISWNGGISGATFTTAGGGVNSDSAWFYWNTQPSDARETPYIFTVIARDNGCPLAGQSVKAFAVKVLPQATASISVNDTDQCITGHSFDFINNTPSGDAAWYLPDGREMHGHHLSGITFNGPGAYATKLIVVENGGCSDTAETSVIVYARPNPDFTTVSNFYCAGKPPVVFHPATPGGIFTGKNIIGNTFIPSLTGSDTIHYMVTVNGCTADTLKTTQVYPSP